MKRVIALCLTVALCLTTSLALAQTRTLTAEGTASVQLSPNQASLVIGVTTQEKTMHEAQTLNAQQMDALIAAIEAQGVAQTDIATSSFSVSPVYSYQYGKIDGGEELSGYSVENMLSVTLRDLTDIGSLLDAAMAAGANQTYALSFDSSERPAAYDQALAAAAKEAQRKAGLLAEAAGEKLAQPIEMAEQTLGGYSGEMAVSSTYDSAATSVLPGNLTVVAKVRVTYALQDGQ